jgi:hypothetical protein
MINKFIIASLAVFMLIACSNEDETINGPIDSISPDAIVGIWTLSEINYPQGDSLVIRYPEEDTISITFKFWKNKTGQMLQFEKGATDTENFHWNLSGNSIVFIWETGEVENITCHQTENKLCLKYSFTTPTGEIVLAIFVFTKTG